MTKSTWLGFERIILKMFLTVFPHHMRAMIAVILREIRPFDECGDPAYSARQRVFSFRILPFCIVVYTQSHSGSPTPVVSTQSHSGSPTPAVFTQSGSPTPAVSTHSVFPVSTQSHSGSPTPVVFTPSHSASSYAATTPPLGKKSSSPLSQFLTYLQPPSVSKLQGGAHVLTSAEAIAIMEPFPLLSPQLSCFVPQL